MPKGLRITSLILSEVMNGIFSQIGKAKLRMCLLHAVIVLRQTAEESKSQQGAGSSGGFREDALLFVTQ